MAVGLHESRLGLGSQRRWEAVGGRWRKIAMLVMSDVVRRGKQRKWTCDFYQVFHMANIVML